MSACTKGKVNIDKSARRFDKNRDVASAKRFLHMYYETPWVSLNGYTGIGLSKLASEARETVAKGEVA